MKTLRALQDRGMTLVHRLAQRVRAAWAAARRGWRRHCQRMVEEAGYAETFLAVVAALAELVLENLRRRYMAEHLAAAYVAIVKALNPDRQEPRWN